jgi:hypothetical protein
MKDEAELAGIRAQAGGGSEGTIGGGPSLPGVEGDWCESRQTSSRNARGCAVTPPAFTLIASLSPALPIWAATMKVALSAQ